MRRGRRLVLSGLLATVLAAVAVVPSFGQDETRSPWPPHPVPDAGFWPTPRMFELWVDRLVEDMIAPAYGMDVDQVYLTTITFKQRFIPWANENRAELQRLLNEFIEAALDKEPPSREQAADWAERALPLLGEFTEVFGDIAGEMRTYLTEPQQTRLDQSLAAFHLGVAAARQQLSVWADGGFDPHSWELLFAPEPPPPPTPLAEAPSGDMPAGGAPGTPSDAPPGLPAGAGPGGVAAPTTAPALSPSPPDEWTIYVENFIRRYQLSANQRAAAYKILTVLQEQRDAYLRRHSQKIADVARAQEAAQTEAERAAAQEAAKKLTQPVDRMFEQLKERLDKLPTRAQRLAAARADAGPPTTMPVGDVQEPP